MQWDLFRRLCQHYIRGTCSSNMQWDLFRRLCQHHQYQRDLLKTAFKIHQATSTKFSKVAYHQNYNQGYINTKDKSFFTNMVLQILKGPVIFNFISKGPEDQSYLDSEGQSYLCTPNQPLSTNKCNVLVKFLFLTFKILNYFSVKNNDYDFLLSISKSRSQSKNIFF